MGRAWRLQALWHWILADLSARSVQCVARIRLLRKLPRRVLIPIERVLICSRGGTLFDRAFYRLQNPDVARTLRPSEDPFMHYLRHGWREGRAPNARFDDGYYRAEAGLARTTPVSPLAHFIAFGQTGGLCPVPGIDLAALDKTNPALAVARMDPYRGLVAGKVVLSSDDRPNLEDVAAKLWQISRRPASEPEVDVIIPVYQGRAETLNTLLHVLTAQTHASLEIICIDDATPDQNLAEDLRRLARSGLIRLLHQPENRGFSAAINAGMAAHPDRDVIWLNADTEVYDGWADRLREAAYSASMVATVTPLTNNGTICSYPRMNADNPGRLEIAWSDVDRIATEANRGQTVATPTAVGFATYVRRAALDALGWLDEAAFGRGYGEENDFSQRAVANGWLNLIATDTVVRHFGATSFQGDRAARVETALQMLDARYPDYRRHVQQHLCDDPTAPARHAIDVARLNALRGPRNVLLVTHSLGGGTQQHVAEEIARLSAEGASVFVLSGGLEGGDRARLTHPDAAALPSLENLSLSGDRLWMLLADLDLDVVDIHHLIDFPISAPDVFRSGCAAIGVPVTFVVHDYFAICPRVNLVDTRGFYCGEPARDGCVRCIARRGSRVGRTDIVQWRERYGSLLRAAETVRVPDQDVADRLIRYFPRLPFVVRPHERQSVARKRTAPRRSGPTRIAILGAIGSTKGFDAVLSLAHHVQARALPMALTVIGYTQNDAAAQAVGVEITGAYVNDDVEALIDKADPDVIWIPSLWPETYSYTLSIALASGRAVAAFDIGALGTRLRAAGVGTLLPLQMAREPEELFSALAAAAGSAASSSDLSVRSRSGLETLPTEPVP